MSSTTSQSLTVTEENGAASYAAVATPARTVKPVFILDFDIFGTRTVPKESWLNHVELYRAIGNVVPIEQLIGLQRVRGMWRIYLDSYESRLKLITQGLVVRSKSIKIYANNPAIGNTYDENTTMIRVKSVPLSAFDGQIKRDLELKGCDIQSLYRERLRVDGYLTNCETGDRIVIVRKLENPLPTSMTIGGKYIAIIRHRGQPNENAHCSNCLQTGHVARDCINDKVCRHCKSAGHIQSNCPALLKDEDSADDSSDDESDSEDDEHIDDETTSESLSQTETHKPPTDTTPVSSTDTTHVSSSGTTHVSSPVAESTDSKDESRKKKKSKKSKGKKPESKQPHNQTIIDSFLKETPSRKSSQLPSDVRSPLDELNNNPKKKCNAK